MKKLLNLSAVVVIVCFPRIASAVPMESGYPAAQKNANPVCYMEQQKGLTLDLTQLCASSDRPIRLVGNTSNSYSSSASSGGFGRSISSRISGSSGNCNSPDDIAADGSRCGGRAASQRPENTNTGTTGTNTSSSRIGQRTIPQGRIIEFTQRSR